MHFVLIPVAIGVAGWLLYQLGKNALAGDMPSSDGSSSTAVADSLLNPMQSSLPDPGEDQPADGVSGGSGPDAIEQWRSLAETNATTNPVLDPNEILAIVWEESSGDPNSENPSDPSYGLMGVELPIGKQFSRSVATAADLFVPENNVEAGSGFLAYLKLRYATRFPLTDPQNGWVQIYNVGEPKFLAGRRNTAYQAKFVAHLSALGG